MATKSSIGIGLTLLLLFSIAENLPLPPKVFNVFNYGAIANGRTDNSMAFRRTWFDACNYRGKSRVLIPNGIFSLDTVSFVGPCNGPISFVIKGMLIAPTDPRKFITDTWIGFRYINRLTVRGGGVLDGQGSAAWKYNDCSKNSRCVRLPASIRFDFIRNSKVHHLKSINSKNIHINVFACDKMSFSNIRLLAPGDSPNTDGIHIGSSTNIKISHSVIRTGDDCVSMVSGSQGVEISDVSCGPGHGISIGSLGKSHANEFVTGISVRNSTFIGSDNGVRIKTWGAMSARSLAANITFQDIVMINVDNPIVIDQQYCPHRNCLSGESSVQVQDVLFKNIWGTSSTKTAVSIQCSRILPCRNVKLIDISLGYTGREGGPATAMCSNVFGSSYGKQIPHGCL